MKKIELTNLKKAMSDNASTKAINLIKAKKYVDALQYIESLNEEKIDAQTKLNFAEAYYQAAKMNFSDETVSLKYLGRAIKLNNKHYYANSRLNLINECRRLAAGNIDANKQERMRKYRDRMKILCGVSCKHNLGESFLHCMECKGRVHRPSTRLERTDEIVSYHAVGIYRYMGDERASEEYTRLIRSFKKDGKELSLHFAELLSDSLKKNTDFLKQIDFIATVPGDPARLRDRGYNPPGLIAMDLSKILSIPFIDEILIKRGAARARELDFKTVCKNFYINTKNKIDITDRNVLLIDDVTTRGYTLSACALQLKKRGAGKIFAALLAQAETTHRGDVQRQYDIKKLSEWHMVSQSKYLGPVRFRNIYDRLSGNIMAIFDMSDEQLAALGISSQVIEGIRAQTGRIRESEEFIRHQTTLMDKCGGGIITLDDPLYPDFLKKSTMCHPILYFRGNISKFTHYSRALAIVGTRNALFQSVEIAKTTAKELAKRQWIIVSGMATGIDSAAHEGALEVNGLTMAVLGCGPDVVYPPQAKNIYERIVENGVVISEFPFGTKIEDWKLQKRNKTIIAASKAAFVVQSSATGGAMNAVKACKEQKKRIFTYLPGEITESFTGNLKIREEYGGEIINPDNAALEINEALINE